MGNDLRVLFVNNFRGRGGGEEFLRDLLPGLLAKGVRVGLVCRPGTPLVEMFKDSGVDLHPLDRSGLGAVTSVMAIGRIIREQGYQIVNVQRGHDIIQSWTGSLFSRTDPVLMYTPQVPEFLRSRFLLRRMDAVATISRYIRDRLTSFDPSLAPRTSIVYYGIDLERFRPEAVQRGWLRQRFGLDANVKIIGTVGDLWKNQIEFLDVVAVLRRTFPSIRYAIVGSTDRSESGDAFQRRAEELGLADAVLRPGRMSKADMQSFYADIDLAVSTYRNEGFGIWILEAMAMGRPVVAFDAGGIRDSLEGSPCGLLIPGGAREMADAISKLLADSGRVAAMSAAAPGWVRSRFGRQRMIDDYEQYFRGLLTLHRGARR
jgi:glycosyltransferase involved in cell wall biosynthesis